MIIGLTGSFCAGKDTAANYLVKKGLIHYSLSDSIREEADRKEIQKTRENLQNLGNELRAKYGNSVLAKRVLKRYTKNKSCIVTSLRHPDEIKELRKQNDFYLVNMDGPAKLRFERMLKR